MPAPTQAAAIELGQQRRLEPHGLAQRDRGFKRLRRDVAEGGALDELVPDPTKDVVEQHPHEAMIEANGPEFGGGHAGQDDPRQLEPPLDPAPLILTLALAPADQARFDRLREAYFPPERNVVGAHVTLFHQLPGLEAASAAAEIGALCRVRAPFAVAVTGLRSLGRGVAFTLASPKLTALRGVLAEKWASRLTRQDRQAFRPHVTVQNKVAPEQAAALLRRLAAGFEPFAIEAQGLALWRYRGGPWDAAGAFPFTCRPADPP